MDTPTLLSEEDLKALPRRVGRMPYEQVRTLFDENRARLEAHDCPLCVYVTYSEWPPCDAGVALWDTWQAQGIPPAARSKLLDQHKRDCPACQPRFHSWREFDHCPYGDQLFALERIYSRRLAHLSYKERQNGK